MMKEESLDYVESWLAKQKKEKQDFLILLSKAHMKDIKTYIHYFGGCYAGFYNYSVEDVTPLSLVVTYNVSRSDPLFDDYATKIEVPFDFLRASNKALWMNTKDEEANLARKEEHLKKKKEELRQAKLRQTQADRDVQAILKELT